MSLIARASSAPSQSGVMAFSKTVFEAREDGDSCSRWGPVLAVFGEDLDKEIRAMSDAVQGTDDLMEDMQSASRRHSAMLEAMGHHDARPAAPVLIYELTDNFSVLIVSARSGDSAAAAHSACLMFNREVTGVTEVMFGTVLASAIHSYFERYSVEDKVVAVDVGDCSYKFVRTEFRDNLIQNLRIGTPAGGY